MTDEVTHIHQDCPKCRTRMRLEWAKQHWFPYIHTDYNWRCETCGNSYMFGVPVDLESGLALYIWSDRPLEVLKEADELDAPECPFHSEPMRLTKVVESGAERFIQWKCPTCYYAVSTGYYPDTLGAKVRGIEAQGALERLEALGYLQ